jgi:hypothetical protein
MIGKSQQLQIVVGENDINEFQITMFPCQVGNAVLAGMFVS